MERRKHARFKKRVAVSVDGKAALINNVSREGLQVCMTGIPSSREVTIRFQIGEKNIEIQGVVLWVKKNSFLYQPNLIGISLTTSCPEYLQLVSEQQILQ